MEKKKIEVKPEPIQIPAKHRKMIEEMGIKVFKDDSIKINWFSFTLEMISNGYLLTLTYIPVESKYWYREVFSLKTTEEIETLLLEVTKHLI